MLTIIYNGHKITGDAKDIYEFIKLTESEVVSESEVVCEKNDEKLSTKLERLGYEVEINEPIYLKAKKQSYSFIYKVYFVIDFNKNEIQKYLSDDGENIYDHTALNVGEIELLDELFGKDNWKKIEQDSTDYTAEPIEKMDKETADEIKECGDCVEAWRNSVPCPDKDGRCPYKKTLDYVKAPEEDMKDLSQCLSLGEGDLVNDIVSLEVVDEIESIKYVGAYDSEHGKGHWLRFIISYYGGHTRYLEVNYEEKKFVYFRITKGSLVHNLVPIKEIKKCLAGYEQDTYDKWWKKYEI